MLHEYYHTDKVHYPGLHGFCDLNCIRLILEAYGVDHPCLYIDASMDMKISLDSDIDKYNEELLHGTKIRNVVPKHSDKITKHYYQDGQESSKIFQLNLDRISNNKLIAVGVDNFYLPYMKDDHYKKMHAWHTIVVCGYEKNENYENVFVIDWAAPWLYKGAVPKDNFLLARKSSNKYRKTDIFSGLPIQNYWIEVEGSGWDNTAEELLKVNLSLTIKQYFHPNNEKPSGIKSIDYLHSYLSEVAHSPADINKESFAVLHRKLYIALLRHKLFTQYLKISTQYINSQAIERSIEDMHAINEAWEVVLMLTLKISLTGKKPICNKICDKLRAIETMEKQLCESLIKLEEIIK
jgi:hypothetical protein